MARLDQSELWEWMFWTTPLRLDEALGAGSEILRESDEDADVRNEGGLNG